MESHRLRDDLAALLPRFLERSDDVYWILELQPLRAAYANPAFERVLGVPVVALLADLDAWSSRIHPDDRESVRRALACAASGERDTHAWSYRWNHPDGSDRRLEVSAELLRDDQGQPCALLGISRDVSERVRVQDELHHREKILQWALRTANMGHWSYDLRTSEIEWSPQVYVLFGRAPELGPPDYETNVRYYQTGSRARLETAIRAAIETGQPNYQDYQVRRDDGQIVFHYGPIVPETVGGEVVRLSGVVQDVTDRVLAGAELRVRRRRAERTNRATNAALQLLSRQLRRPLESLAGQIEEIPLETPAAMWERLEAVRDQIRAVSRLFDDVSDNVPGADVAGDVEETFDPRHVLDGLRRVGNVRLEGRPVSIESAIDDDVPTRLNGSVVRLTHLLHLLLDNAIVYTRRGRIELRAHWIPRAASSSLGELVVEIQDTGPGIPAHEVARVFDPLFRGRNAHEDGIAGHGMGLTVSRSIAGRLGAELHVESVPPQGTLASVSIPLGIARPSDRRTSAPRPRGLRHARRRLVVVGRRHALLESLSGRLDRDVIVMPDPVDLPDQLGPQCDAVFVDVASSRFDAEALIDQLRSGRHGPAGIHVALVGLHHTEDEQIFAALRARGSNAFLDYDCDLDRLVEILGDLLV